MDLRRAAALVAIGLALVVVCGRACPAGERFRVIIETDAGGDPDDEQSMVRFLLYANEWDVEGIICVREKARNGENRNQLRTGLEIVRAQVKAYGDCYPSLVKHDERYPKPADLLARTIGGLAKSDEGVRLIIDAVDRPDPRPVWFCNWGTIDGSAPSNLRRALDRVLKERGKDGYATFKSKLRLSSDDQFGDHTDKIDPPFPIWIDTFRPELERKRWYHRFSPLTMTAGGFDIQRDLLTGHGPLGASYPTNTHIPQKEGDSMTFIYLIPTGMNDVDHPLWGSWAGRYGPNEKYPGKPYYWANQTDAWNGTTHRDNTLARWAADLQNDFRARLDWCVKDVAHANHAPKAMGKAETILTVVPGQVVQLDAGEWIDPDRNALRMEWAFYPETGSFKGEMPAIENPKSARAKFMAPTVPAKCDLHVLLTVRDDGVPPLARYRRVVVTLDPAKK